MSCLYNLLLLTSAISIGLASELCLVNGQDLCYRLSYLVAETYAPENIMSKLRTLIVKPHLKSYLEDTLLQRPDSAHKVSHSSNFAQWHIQKGGSHYQNNEILKNESGQTQDCSYIWHQHLVQMEVQL